jgi:hypothetical protein
MNYVLTEAEFTALKSNQKVIELEMMVEVDKRVDTFTRVFADEIIKNISGLTQTRAGFETFKSIFHSAIKTAKESINKTKT